MATYRSPWMNEELEIFRDAVRKFFESEFAPLEERWQKQQRVDREAWTKSGEMGILAAAIPEEYGGAGGTHAHDAVIFEEQAYAGVMSLGLSVHNIVSHYLMAYASEEQKQRWLPRMATGELVAAIAMSEPGAGSDLQGVKTKAVRDGDHYVINGSKTFITNGYHADLICLVAKTDPSQGAKGTSLIMVETRDLEGFRRGRILEKIGQKGQDTAELFFDDARVPVANLLGSQEGKGFYQLMEQLPWERLMIGIYGVAVMEAAIQETVGYVKQRKAFGQTLFDFQNTRFTLAECKTEAHIGRVFMDNCLERMLAGELDAATASMAKWWGSQKQCEIVDACLQLHGGYGYMLEYPIAKMYADSRVQRIYGGSNEIMKELIARSL